MWLCLHWNMMIIKKEILYDLCVGVVIVSAIFHKLYSIYDSLVNHLGKLLATINKSLLATFPYGEKKIFIEFN